MASNPAAAIRKPPQAPLSFIKTPASILEDTQNLVVQARKAQNRVLATIKPDWATFSTALLPLAHSENYLALQAPLLALYQEFSTDPVSNGPLRKAQKLLSDFNSDSGTNRDLYDLVHSILSKNESIDSESHHLVEEMDQGFIRSGLAVKNDRDQDRLKEIGERINQLKNDFHEIRARENGSIWFTREELAGAPNETLSQLEVGEVENEKMLRVQFNNSNHRGMFSYVLSGQTRKRFHVANGNKCKKNVALLAETAALRQEAAHILGYSNHASFRLETRMAKNPGTVDKFLLELKDRLAPNAKAELERLKDIKRVDVQSRGEAFDGSFYPWDYAFYNRLTAKQHHSIDKMKVAEYYTLQATIKSMLQTFESLFNLEFEKITEDTEELVWHEDVDVFRVWDGHEQGGKFLGYLYFDLFAREGKEQGAGNFNLQPGFLREDGTRNFPSTVLMCSFSKPSSKKPCLLYHNDLVTVFHELGHAIHNMVSKTTYARFHGTNVAVDIGEAPSQMLENWCRTPSFLKSLGMHYSSISPEYAQIWEDEHKGEIKPPAEIPEEMVNGIIKTRFMHNPLFYLGQVQLAMFDMLIYEQENTQEMKDIDLMETYNNLIHKVQLFDIGEDSDWTCEFASLHHLMEEYDAGYYSYLFSQVYATDMFYTTFKHDLLNFDQGFKYRREVLEKGASQDEMKTLTDFLGRKPSMDAFYEDLGLE